MIDPRALRRKRTNLSHFIKIKQAPPLICFILICLLTTNLYAVQTYEPQFADPVLEPWRWHAYPQLDDAGILCMVEASDKTLWMGGLNAVYQYDGIHFYTYSTQTPGLMGTRFKGIDEDSHGNIYTHSFCALNIFKEGEWSCVFPTRNHLSFVVNAMAIGSDGCPWIGLPYGIVYLGHNEKILYMLDHSHIPNDQQDYYDRVVTIQSNSEQQASLTQLNVVAIKRGMDSTLWAYANGGCLLRFDIPEKSDAAQADIIAPTCKPYYLPDDILAPTRFEVSIFCTQAGELWIANSQFFTKLIQFNPQTETWKTDCLHTRFSGGNAHHGLTQSADGSIWLTGRNRLFHYDQNHWTQYSHDDLPPTGGHSLRTFATGTSDLWLSSYPNRMWRLELSQRRWQTYQELMFEAESPQGDLWFLSSDNRVVQHTDTGWYSFGPEDGLMENPSSIQVTRRGQVWCSGSHEQKASIATLEGNQWHRRIHPELGWTVFPWATFEDIQGRLWFGPNRNPIPGDDYSPHLIRYQGTENTAPYDYEVLSVDYHPWASYACFGQDDQDIIWLGDRMLSYQQGRFYHDDDDDPRFGAVVCMHTSPEQELWVGTRYNGLFKRSEGQWIHYQDPAGPGSRGIHSILASRSGKIWFCTDQGLSCLHNDSWAHGVFGGQLTLPREYSTLRESSDEALWINRMYGEWFLSGHPYYDPNSKLEHVTTTRFRSDHEAPDTRLTSNLSRVAGSTEVLITWTGSDPWNDTAPEDLLYSFRLNEGDWSAFRNTTTHLYPKLAPGDYQFEVRAMDRDMNIDTNPAVLSFTVLRPFWQSPWLWTVIITLLAVILYLISRLFIYRQQRITTQLKLEKQRVEDLRELDKMRLQFFTNISHEFRTPLTLILGPLQTLMNRTTDTQSKEQIGILQRNARRLLRLLNQMLDMRKLQEGKTSLDINEDDLVQFVSELVASFEPTAEEQNVSLTFKSSHTYLTAPFDEDKVDKILYNLLSNAVKFTPPHGSIQVQLELEPKNENHDEHLRLTVEDTGVGIPAEDLPRIFNRFYQVQTDLLKNEGTGIGLALTKELVTLCGGTIDVISPAFPEADPPCGTRFDVCLPLNENPLAEAPPMSSSQPTLTRVTVSQPSPPTETVPTTEDPLPVTTTPDTADNGERPLILLVEDNQEMRLYIRRHLEPHYQVQEAADGRQGYDLACQIIPDLIISDVMMPEMDGIELCGSLKRHGLTCHIPIILLTARGSQQAQIEGLETGADDYVVKPFDADLLLARVRNLLASRKLLQERFNQDDIVNPREVAVTTADAEFLQRAMDVVEEFIDDSDFDALRFAERMALSRASLYRKIKGVTGQSVHQFIKTIRVRHAAKLLIEQGLNVSEAAVQVGFLDPNYFTKCFKQQFECTPSEYIAKAKKNKR